MGKKAREKPGLSKKEFESFMEKKKALCYDRDIFTKMKHSPGKRHDGEKEAVS